MEKLTGPATKGPAEWFTGEVSFHEIYQGQEPSRTRIKVVRFTPGAHTAWHMLSARPCTSPEAPASSAPATER